MTNARYRTIVADPPWDHSDGTGVNLSRGSVTGLPYQTMTLAEIRRLPVRDLAASRAHLYLWTTGRFLPKAQTITTSWGFDYSATLVWCKEPRGWAPGGAYANNVEFILFATRDWGDPRTLEVCSFLRAAAATAQMSRREIDLAVGTSDMAGWWLSELPHRAACPTNENWQKLRAVLGFGDECDLLVAAINAEKTGPASQASPTRWFRWPRGAHSAKPEAFLDLVETVSAGPYLEMFARRQRLGWDTWGDEALNHVGRFEDTA